MKEEKEDISSSLNIYKLIRNARGMSITELSEKSTVSKNYISQIESGVRTPSNEIKEKLATALNVKCIIFDTFEFPDDKKPNFYERALLKILSHLI